jgi:NAD/NADP transhydrogenase alpha subunit
MESGYAKAMTEEFTSGSATDGRRRWRSRVSSPPPPSRPESAHPHHRDMVTRMAPGSLIVDIAAERGGNANSPAPVKP